MSNFWATLSDTKASMAITFKTEISSSSLVDLRTDSIGCIISHFSSCIAWDLSDASEERAMHACSTCIFKKKKSNKKERSPERNAGPTTKPSHSFFREKLCSS